LFAPLADKMVAAAGEGVGNIHLSKPLLPNLHLLLPNAYPFSTLLTHHVPTNSLPHLTLPLQAGVATRADLANIDDIAALHNVLVALVASAASAGAGKEEVEEGSGVRGLTTHTHT
jgi:hypothetical protein